MSIFDLLFIAVFLASVATLFAAAISALRGRGAQALRILRGYGLCAGVYLGVVVITSLFMPRRVLNVGDPICWDDWCITVENVSRGPAHANASSSVVALRLSSRARRVAQRENGVAVYLTDDRGRRYNPVPDQSAVPFNVLLQPGESVTTIRAFELPADAHPLGVVIRHEGGFPIGWFIIGSERWFRKPTIVRLP